MALRLWRRFFLKGPQHVGHLRQTLDRLLGIRVVFSTSQHHAIKWSADGDFAADFLHRMRTAAGALEFDRDAAESASAAEMARNTNSHGQTNVEAWVVSYPHPWQGRSFARPSSVPDPWLVRQPRYHEQWLWHRAQFRAQ